MKTGYQTDVDSQIQRQFEPTGDFLEIEIVEATKSADNTSRKKG
jgi:hypothetical protein